MALRKIAVLAVAIGFLFAAAQVAANPTIWKYEWPDTDSSKTSIDFSDILWSRLPKHCIPSIDEPRFKGVSDVKHLAETEPVIGLVIIGDACAYPLQVLIWHEIVIESVGVVPISVTFCVTAVSSKRPAASL